MQSAEQLVQRNHPHMSDGMRELIVRDARIYAGMIAAHCMEQKTTGAVKQILSGLIEDGQAAQKDHERYFHHYRVMNETPIEAEARKAAHKAAKSRKNRSKAAD